MLIGIVDSGGANLASVQFAIQRAGFDSFLSADQATLEKADKLILPGVGAASLAMNNLREKKLVDFLRSTHQPLMGICLGMQLLFEYSEEGNIDCLGLIPGKVKSIPKDDNFSIPHMGWNQATFVDGARLQGELSASEQFYFVHSYYVDQPDDSLNWLRSEYGGQLFTSGISRGNCFATQFHPEKSQEKGLQIYRNFIAVL